MPIGLDLDQCALDELRNIEGLWIDTDLSDRYLYDHDKRELPIVSKALIGETVPAVIVRPKTEDQVISIIEWANKHKVPLIPRAAGTSGYGGIVPVKGSVVIELINFNHIISIDKDKKQVTVEPCITWKSLDEALTGEGLAARMYPSSAPEATVGGWLAQGGAGFGSYQYGWFEQNVEAATLICPDGSKKLLKARELSLVSGAMGTTGIITSITLRLRESEKQVVFGIQAKSAEEVRNILAQISKNAVPLWHAGFINPTAANLKNKVSPKIYCDDPGRKPVLPESYIIILACAESRSADIESNLNHILSLTGGRMLPADAADYEWEDRFNALKTKRVSLSLVSAEIVIPVNGISRFLNQIDRFIKLPVLVEAVAVKGDEIVMLCGIPHDVRKISYNFAATSSLSILRIAKRLGGKAYASGLFFSQEARRVHGMRLKQWQDFKAEKDPKDILNPYKISGIRRMKMFTSSALWLEPVIRAIGNSTKPEFKEVM